MRVARNFPEPRADEYLYAWAIRDEAMLGLEALVFSFSSVLPKTREAVGFLNCYCLRMLV